MPSSPPVPDAKASLVEKLRSAWDAHRGWLWPVVLLPFLVTRAAWVLVAAFARATFQPNPTYLEYFQRGGQPPR